MNLAIIVFMIKLIAMLSFCVFAMAAHAGPMDAEDSEARDQVTSFLRDWNPPPTVKEVEEEAGKSLEDLRANKPIADSPLTRFLKYGLGPNKVGFLLMYQLIDLIKENKNDEAFQIKSAKVAVAGAEIASVGAGTENSSLTALKELLESKFPKVRALAAAGLQGWGTPLIRGGVHGYIDDSNEEYFIKKYYSETDTEAKTELGNLVEMYNPKALVNRPGICGRIFQVLFGK